MSIDPLKTPVHHHKPVVGIDGPAGAGKSTAAKAVASTLGYTFIDTGALFRTVALAAEQEQLDIADKPRIEALAQELVQQKNIRLESDAQHVMRVILRGEAPGELLRTRRISQLVPIVSMYAGVREAILVVLRAFGTEGGIVLEGRDICTVVFPDAEVKIYLTASAEVRATRRVQELLSRGETASYEEILADVHRRDHLDMTREIAPLRQAEDATIIDSDALNAEEVVERIVTLARAEEEKMR